MVLSKRLAVCLMVGVILIIFSGCNQSNQTDSEPKQSKQEAKVSEDTTQKKTVPKYEIVYSISKKRYDGGKNFYILIEPVNASNDDFKKDVKSIIKDMTNKNGPKISIEFHDDKQSLTVSYNQYGDMSLGRPRNKEEETLLALHYIANFQGGLETGLYFNALSFFPVSGNKAVEKYAGNIEFNPSDYQS